MPSLIEATSLSAMEGMACAKAILSTNVGGLPFLVVHEVNGLLVPPADSQALADGMKRLLLDPDLIRRLGQNSRKRVEEDLDWSAVAQKTEQIYRLACLKPTSS
jgi:glycosyltransferase involved in cell wall biosynthesis